MAAVANSSTTQLNVFFHKDQETLLVGSLLYQGQRIYFEYTPDFLKAGLELSPLILPLQSGVFEFSDSPFDALPGVFGDSLPDGWGKLLMDRRWRNLGLEPSQMSPLDRLSFIGARGMGALSYLPAGYSNPDSSQAISLSSLAEQSEAIIEGQTQDVLPELIRAGGSPAGARPKVVLAVSADHKHMLSGTEDLPKGYTHYLIKFPAKDDPKDIAAIEMTYAEMARRALLDMPDTYLFNAKGKSYFGVKRFDRGSQGERYHIHTLAGLIHADYRHPSEEYGDLLKVTHRLTNASVQVEEAFGRMVFNILAHNRDDHTKNFSFKMSPKGHWALAPFYDLTYSMGPNGEHSLLVAGEGKNPGLTHILQEAKNIGINQKRAYVIYQRVAEAVSQWNTLAKQMGVSSKTRLSIQKSLNQVAAQVGTLPSLKGPSTRSP